MKAYIGKVAEEAPHIFSLCLAIPDIPDKNLHLKVEFTYNGMFQIEDDDSPKGVFKILLCEGKPDKATMKQIVAPAAMVEFFKKVFDNFEPTE